jgi:hypothetical protein
MDDNNKVMRMLSNWIMVLDKSYKNNQGVNEGEHEVKLWEQR